MSKDGQNITKPKWKERKEVKKIQGINRNVVTLKV